jgi:hypothetical protein
MRGSIGSKIRDLVADAYASASNAQTGRLRGESCITSGPANGHDRHIGHVSLHCRSRRL